jgi:uncharacterized membrane protein YfcA
VKLKTLFMPHWEIIIFFFVIAFVYASVGFGGGSSYIAVLALYNYPIPELRLIALICNIIVVTGGTVIFIRNRQLDWKKVIPLVAVSVPLAFLGAKVKLTQDAFFILLGCSLIVAAILLWMKFRYVGEQEAAVHKSNYLRDGLLGGAIGFLSGMVGIGGGIFLSPMLNLMKWDMPKKIAATASFFILVNSVAGIAGQQSIGSPAVNYTTVSLLCGAVLAGGQIGSRTGAVKFDQILVRRITAVVVFVAGIDVLIRHIGLQLQ